MEKRRLTLAWLLLITSCHPGQNSAERRTLKAETDERARKNAEQDAIQAQRQLNLVAAQSRNSAETNDAAPAPPGPRN